MIKEQQEWFLEARASRTRPHAAAFLFIELFAMLWSGCASSAPPLPPSLELPAPVTDLRAVRKGDKIYLAWTVPTQTTDHERVRRQGPTEICRNPEASISTCQTVAGTLLAPAETVITPAKKRAQAAAVTASYVDTVPAGASATSEATYAVEVLNDRHRSAGFSNRVKVSLAPTLPPVPDFSARVTAAGVLLSWTCPPATSGDIANLDYRLRIYRRQEKAGSDSQVGEVALRDCWRAASPDEEHSATQFLDTAFEWEKTYSYRATVVTVVRRPGQPEIQVEGDDTPSVGVFTHDVFPPSVPSGVQAVFSGVGQQPFIDLVWTPDSDADLAGYNVYRHTEGGEPVKINGELVRTPAYRDTGVQPRTKYFYAVASVDVRGNESARSEEAVEAVP